MNASDIKRVITQITPDPTLENRLRNRISVLENAKKPSIISKKRSICRKALVAFAVAACFIITAIFGIPLLSHTSENKNPNGFKGFSITAYALDGSAVNLEQNVNISYDDNQAYADTFRGIPLKIGCQNSDSIHITASGGNFLTFDESTGKTDTLGNDIKIKPDSKIYWSLDPTDPAWQNKTFSVDISALKDGQEIGSTGFDIDCFYKKIDIAEASGFLIANKKPDEAYKLNK
jgi:hypothetical protein